MKKSVKLRDFLSAAGIADEDKETQYKILADTMRHNMDMKQIYDILEGTI